MAKQPAPLSLRISPDLHRRLEECASRLRQKKHALAQAAVEAAVEAIEKNDYRLVVPIEFSVSQVPAPADIEALADQIMEDEARKLTSAAGLTPEQLNEATAPAAPAPGPKPGTAAASTAAKVSYRKPPSRKRHP